MASTSSSLDALDAISAAHLQAISRGLLPSGRRPEHGHQSPGICAGCRTLSATPSPSMKALKIKQTTCCCCCVALQRSSRHTARVHHGRELWSAALLSAQHKQPAWLQEVCSVLPYTVQHVLLTSANLPCLGGDTGPRRRAGSVRTCSVTLIFRVHVSQDQA